MAIFVDILASVFIHEAEIASAKMGDDDDAAVHGGKEHLPSLNDDERPVIIIKMKQGNTSSRELEVISKETLQQIKSKKYGFGYLTMLAYGIAFRNKEVSITSEKIG